MIIQRDPKRERSARAKFILAFSHSRKYLSQVVGSEIGSSICEFMKQVAPQIIRASLQPYQMLHSSIELHF